MMLGYPLSVLAEYAIWIEMVLQPLQADIIVGELPLEIPDRVPLHGAISLLNGDALPSWIPTAKG